MKIPKRGSKVIINWLDAFGKGAWNGVDDIEKGLKSPIECEIIGYLVGENKDFVVLSMGLQNNPDSKPFLHLEFIPRGAIKEIKSLSDI